jgi:Xaa-Pro dipeptidase
VKSTPQTGNYSRHVAEIQRRYDAALEVSGCNVAVVGAGVPEYRFLDDQPHPFVGNPDFLQWVPLTEHPGSCLVHRPGSRPLLVVLQPNDYWHEPPTMPDEIITREFDVRVVGTPADVLAALPAPNPRMAYIGPGTQWSAVPAPAQLNPEKLLSHLHYQRANKTAWEVDCIRAANELAAAGHRAAERGFRDGGNEFEILNMFLGGCRQLEPELPYPAIVALNGHAATLHYQRRARTPIANGDRHSLLIDAGCSSRGYASDITRTYSYSSTEFAGMVQDMDRLQQKLCAEVRPGVAFPDLHRLAHHEIAGLLRGWGLVRATPERSFRMALAIIWGCRFTTWAASWPTRKAAACPNPMTIPGCGCCARWRPARWSRSSPGCISSSRCWTACALALPGATSTGKKSMACECLAVSVSRTTCS